MIDGVEISDYQKKLVKMLEDERVFHDTLNKIHQNPNFTYSMDSVGALLRMSEHLSQALTILSGQKYELPARERLVFYAALGGSLKNPSELEAAFIVIYNFDVRTIQLAHSLLNLKSIDDGLLKEVAKLLLDAGKESKTFSDSLK